MYPSAGQGGCTYTGSGGGPNETATLSCAKDPADNANITAAKQNIRPSRVAIIFPFTPPAVRLSGIRLAAAYHADRKARVVGLRRSRIELEPCIMQEVEE